LVVFAGAADTLWAAPAETLSLSVKGPFAGSLRAESDNLVLRTARVLAAAAGVGRGARFALSKALPVASGIGGGSADAAAALRLLHRLWAIAPGCVDLPALAAVLGADVPVCLASRPARMSGIGEALAQAPAIPPCGLVLLNPGVPLATADVFRARCGGFSKPAALPRHWPSARDMARDLARLRNDLELPAQVLRPEIGDALGALASHPECLLARMSGSGATCFGLFATGEQAARTARLLDRPGWWSWGGTLATPLD
jgi:4-diphosphocytidyl-2-C-methyl-D-erythritol kinase